MPTPSAQTAAEQFIAKLKSNPSLAKRLEATGSSTSLAQLGATVIALAAEQGVTLTLADLEAWRVAHAPTAPEGELSDMELEAVAGGKTFSGPAPGSRGVRQ